MAESKAGDGQEAERSLGTEEDGAREVRMMYLAGLRLWQRNSLSLAGSRNSHRKTASHSTQKQERN